MSATAGNRKPGATCPQCAGEIPLGVAQCPACGYNRVTGMGGAPAAKRPGMPRPEPDAEPVRGPVVRSANPVQGAVFGVIGAVIAAVIWVLVGAFTGYEVSYVAVLVGGLIGWMISVGSHKNSPAIGAMAILFTVAAIFASRVAIVSLAVTPEEVVDADNAYDIAALALVQEELDKESSGKTIDALSDGELRARMKRVKDKRMRQLTDKAVAEMARNFVRARIENLSFYDRFMGDEPWFFALCCLLGAVAAYGQTGIEKKIHQKKF